MFFRFLAILIIFSAPSFGHAQQCSDFSTAGYAQVGDAGKGKRNRGYVCYRISVYSNRQAVVTLRHLTQNADWNVGISREFDHDERTFIDRTKYQNNSGSASEFFVLPPEATGKYILVAWPVSENPSNACLVFHQFDDEAIFASAFGCAFAQWAITQLLAGEDATESATDNAGRVTALGLSVLRGRDATMVGFDAVMNEVSIALADAFGGGSFLFTFGLNFMSSYYEEAGRYVFPRQTLCH